VVADVLDADVERGGEVDEVKWIDWHGGECPVEIGALVHVKHRDGEIFYGAMAGCYDEDGASHARCWLHDGSDGDIVQYMPVIGTSAIPGVAPVTARSVLEAAAGHMQARAATYDKPEGERSMARAVQAFCAITGRDMTTAEGWLFMAVLKQVRAFQNPDKPHRDSLEDMTAYCALLAEEMLGGAQ
jgi:hypothetical protein